MRFLKTILSAVALVLITSSTASAASITFALDCTFSGPTNDGACTPNGFYGTVTLSDNLANSNLLDIRVDMDGSWYGTRIALNVNFTPSAPHTDWVGLTAGMTDPTFGSNNQGNTWVYFDLSWLTANGTDPWLITIGLEDPNNKGSFANLDPSMFAFITDDPEAGPAGVNVAPVYLSVFRQDLPSKPTFSNVVGSTSVVPEPTSVALLGIGLLGVAAAARRRTRRQS